MNDKLINLVHDIDVCRHTDGVCKTCLVDILASTLHEVLAEIGTDADAVHAGPQAWPAQAH